MYELRCPKCGNVSQWPFVRIGAVALCARCKQTHVIAPDLVTRRLPAPQAPATGLEEPLNSSLHPEAQWAAGETALLGQPAIQASGQAPAGLSLLNDPVESLPASLADRPGDVAASWPHDQGAAGTNKPTPRMKTPSVVLLAGWSLLALGLILWVLWQVTGQSDSVQETRQQALEMIQMIRPGTDNPDAAAPRNTTSPPSSAAPQTHPAGSPSQRFGELFTAPEAAVKPAPAKPPGR